MGGEPAEDSLSPAQARDDDRASTNTSGDRNENTKPALVLVQIGMQTNKHKIGVRTFICLVVCLKFWSFLFYGQFWWDKQCPF